MGAVRAVEILQHGCVPATSDAAGDAYTLFLPQFQRANPFDRGGPSRKVRMADERVLDLVSDIYEAALDATRWPAVLNSVGDAVGGPIVVYGLYDPASALAQIYAPRVDPEHVRRF